MKYFFLAAMMIVSGSVYANLPRADNVVHWGTAGDDLVVLLNDETRWDIPVDHCPKVVEGIRNGEVSELRVRSRIIRQGTRLVFDEGMICRVEVIEASKR